MKMKLYSDPGNKVEITFFEPGNRASDAAIVIFAGGAYSCRAEHEGKGYAEFLQKNGICSFVVDYRVKPDRFPIPLLDARRAVRFVRANAERFGINPDKIAVMGSSAGGHLAAMVSTYGKEIENEIQDDIDKADFRPNAQILCYPVILEPASGVAHEGSYMNLLGEENISFAPQIDPAGNVDKSTPPAFIWHTAADDAVNVINSYAYATELRKNNIPTEMHIFPYGNHGLGLAPADPHVAQWSTLLLNWLKLIFG